MKNYSYKKYCIAYLDMLGFENFIKNKDNLARLIALLESFHESKTAEEKKFVRNESGVKAILIPNIMCFSDTIIISIEDDNSFDENGIELNDPRRFDILMCSIADKVSEMCFRTLEVGMALRGAIGYGDVFIDYNKSIIFGPGLVESIRDEQKKARYPRVIISKSLLDILDKPFNINLNQNFYPSPIRHDAYDDIYHIDYLKAPLVKCISDGQIVRVKKIAELMSTNYHEADKGDKENWEWLINYYNLSIDELKLKHNPDNKTCQFLKCKHPNEKDFEKLKIEGYKTNT